MKSLIITLLLPLLVACSSTDLSKTPPFSSVSDQSLSTVRITYLKPLNEGLIFGSGISFLRRPSFEMTDSKPDVPHQTLPTGSMIHLSTIQDEILIDGRSQVAYGSTKMIPGLKADFAYRWGFLSTIKRAPWELNSVPERRKWQQKANKMLR